MEEENCRLERLEQVIPLVLQRVTDRADRSSASRVCKKWYKVEGETRERVTVPLCYAANPGRLIGRFPFLKSLRLKGRPRAEMYGLVPEIWGGFATPWINEIAISKFTTVNSIRLKRIIVTDLDLDVLARALAGKLGGLEIYQCFGFGSDGLRSITKRCRRIERLLIAWSCLVEEKDGDWLHELALHNTCLKVLHCHQTDFTKISLADLETIAKKCRSLVALKISDFDLVELEETLREATQLEEFYGGCIIVDSSNDEKYTNISKSFPPKMSSVGDIVNLHVDELPILYGFATRIQKLDLFRTMLRTGGHCLLLEGLPNLEVLKTSNCIGDDGLLVLSQVCKKLKELEIRVASNQEEQYLVTDRGVISVANNCKKLESLSVAMIEVSNASLLAIVDNLKELRYFGLVLIPTDRCLTVELPLDIGVRALLSGCKKLRKIDLHLFPGYLSDVGMSYIGQFGSNLRRMKLAYAGDSDEGLKALANGCTSLKKLELMNCSFSEKGIATAVRRLSSLRYIWATKYNETERSHLSGMSRPNWRIELSLPTDEEDCHLVAYYSLGKELTDYPEIILRFN